MEQRHKKERKTTAHYKLLILTGTMTLKIRKSGQPDNYLHPRFVKSQVNQHLPLITMTGARISHNETIS